jgi:ribose 1,5-bisphosphokinase
VRGHIVYVMGPSGAGKDTLLVRARMQLSGTPILFAHRYITRSPVSGDENFVALDETEFDVRAAHGLFAFHWRANGHRYGIGIEVGRWQEQGHTVVVSGSRAHFLEILAARADVTPVLITAPPKVLAARLSARGREDASAVTARLQRGGMEIDHPRLRVLENTGTAAEGGAKLAAIIRGCAGETASKA